MQPLLSIQIHNSSREQPVRAQIILQTEFSGLVQNHIVQFTTEYKEQPILEKAQLTVQLQISEVQVDQLQAH